MIEIDIRKSENLFVMSAEGAVGAADFKSLGEAIDGYINEHDEIPSLVFRLNGLPHWKDLGALIAHFRLVKDHHRIIPKVAIVSDSGALAVIRPFVDQFTGAKIRRFPSNAFEDAVNWAAMAEDHPGSFEEIEGLPSDVIGIDARGLISGIDYAETLEPLVREKLKKHQKLKMLVVAGPYFDGYSAGAIWDDARFGLTHFTTFSKLALVTDHEWLRHAAKFFGAFIPADVMIFAMDEKKEAMEWIRT